MQTTYMTRQCEFRALAFSVAHRVHKALKNNRTNQKEIKTEICENRLYTKSTREKRFKCTRLRFIEIRN